MEVEVDAATALCAPVRASPERMQGVRGEPRRCRRTRLAFHVKAGDAGAVARLMDSTLRYPFSLDLFRTRALLTSVASAR